MRVKRKCFARCITTLWCISVSESDSEDDMSDGLQSLPSESLPDPPLESATPSGTNEQPMDPDNQEVNPLLGREPGSEWITGQIKHKTKQSVQQLTKGVYGQKVIESEIHPIARRSLKERRQVYFSEDFVWKSVSSHPYILPLYTIFYNSTKFRYNCFSQYLPMVNLRKLIKIHKVLRTKICKVLTSQTVSAICFLHNRDIFHRDVNSQNILICSDGKARLSNFKHSVNNRTSRGLHGHFFYQAPEVLSGEDYDTTADWFSLGVCLYEMVMNNTPIEYHCMRYNIKFQEIDFYCKIVVLLNCTYYIPKIFPEGLKRALEDFLQKDPTKRLGYKDNLDDFKNHPFFSSIEWNKLENGSLTITVPNSGESCSPKKIKSLPKQTKFIF